MAEHDKWTDRRALAGLAAIADIKKHMTVVPLFPGLVPGDDPCGDLRRGVSDTEHQILDRAEHLAALPVAPAALIAMAQRVVGEEWSALGARARRRLVIEAAAMMVLAADAVGP